MSNPRRVLLSLFTKRNSFFLYVLLFSRFLFSLKGCTIAQRKFSPRMSFPEKALQTRVACAMLCTAWRMGRVFNRSGESRPAPQRVPEALCLCDLSLLESPNIQMCLLARPGQTQGLGLPNKANRTPFSIPGGFLNCNLRSFQPEQVKGREMQFCWGSAGCCSSFFPWPSVCFTKNPGRAETGQKGTFFGS